MLGMISPNGGGDKKRARYGLIWRIKLEYSETKPLWDQGWPTLSLLFVMAEKTGKTFNSSNEHYCMPMPIEN